MTTVSTENTLIERPENDIVRASANIGAALTEYRQIQEILDTQLADCTIEIRGKVFRKKNYWRAVATAFNLSLTLIEERSEDRDEDWGFLCTYRATAPNGRFADGDGTCFAIEKASGQDSVHNVRAHAATRAINRAISNLVGFGEVSAEEMDYREPKPKAKAAAKPSSKSGGKVFDDPVGFGKFKDSTWRLMTEGSIGGDRHEYLLWISGDISKKLEEEPGGKYERQDRERLDHIKKCIAIYDKRIEDMERAEPGNLPANGAEGF